MIGLAIDVVGTATVDDVIDDVVDVFMMMFIMVLLLVCDVVVCFCLLCATSC